MAMTKMLGYDQASNKRYMWMLAGDYEWVIVGIDEEDMLQVYCAQDPNDAQGLNLKNISCQPIEQYIKNIVE